MTKAEKFARLNGIEWSCTLEEECVSEDGKSYVLYDPNPDYSDAKSILEVMGKRGDWHKFSMRIGNYRNNIIIDYILNPDKLLDEAIKFCEEGGNDGL